MKKLKLKIINSQKKHKQALAAIEQLWDSKPGTEEHDALEVLSLLVEDYERRTALAAHSIYRVPVSSSAPLPHPLPLQSHVSNEDTSSTTTTTKTVTCVTGQSVTHVASCTTKNCSTPL